MNLLLRACRPPTLNFSTDYTALCVRRFVTQRQPVSDRRAEAARPEAASPLDLPVLYPSLYAERQSFQRRSEAYLTALALDLRSRLRARGAQPGMPAATKH